MADAEHGTAIEEVRSAEGFERSWLYFSGGGLRAALGSLGVVWFLTHDASGQTWNSVTRVSSVSGGSVENAALMTDPDIETHIPAAFHRFTGHGRARHYALPVIRTLLFASIPIAAAWAITRSDGWLLTTGLIILIVLGLPAAVQELITGYTGARLRGIAASSPDNEPVTGRLHLFAAADTRSGRPVYFVSRRDDSGVRRVLAHDRRSERAGVEFFDIDSHRPTDAAFASSRWPLFHTPAKVTGTRSDHDADDATSPFRIRQTPVFDGDPERGNFNLLDGGLTGTLGTRLDPQLFGLEGTGVMGTIGWEVDDGSDHHPETGEVCVRRIVVDGAKYISTNRWWKLHRIPGFGGLMGAGRAMTVSLDSQITLDRDLADDRPAVWYIPVTGYGRQQPLRRADDSRPAIVARGGDVLPWRERIASWFDVVRRAANTEAVLLEGGTPADADTYALIEGLRRVADRTSYFRLLKRRGLACAASGVANGFVEVHGIGANHLELELLLDEFTTVVRQRGGLEPLLPRRTRYRWPELELVHDAPGAPAAWVSHRGVRTGRARGNTVEAFRAAYDNGFRVFECDVQAIAGDELVGLHTTFGWHLGRFFIPRAVWRMNRNRLRAALRDDDPLDTVEELVRSLPTDVTWNFEAKRSRSMRALLATIDRLHDDGLLVDRPPIISGGMRTATLRLARTHDADLMTAATWREKWRLATHRRVPHVAVVQLPAWLRLLGPRIARAAHGQGIHVQWFGVKSRKQVAHLLVVTPSAGFSTDISELREIDLGAQSGA